MRHPPPPPNLGLEAVALYRLLSLRNPILVVAVNSVVTVVMPWRPRRVAEDSYLCLPEGTSAQAVAGL